MQWTRITSFALCAIVPFTVFSCGEGNSDRADGGGEGGEAASGGSVSSGGADLGGAASGGRTSGGRSSGGEAGAAEGGSGGTISAGGVPGTGGTGTGGSVGPGMDGDACRNNRDCGATLVCLEQRSICVECRTAPDCGPGAICLQNHCEARPACENSLDCNDTNLICAEGPGEGGVCVECAGANDCGEGEICRDGACETACDSDKDCTPLGLLCDLEQGACVACFESSDCASSQYCGQGSCLAQLCEPESWSCNQNRLVRCNSAGSGYSLVEDCPGGCDIEAGPNCVGSEPGRGDGFGPGDGPSDGPGPLN